jgi:hypothetical protein
MRSEPPVIGVLRGLPDWMGDISQLARLLGINEKQARSAIDKARLDGYNIKNVSLKLFQLQPVKGAQTKP